MNFLIRLVHKSIAVLISFLFSTTTIPGAFALYSLSSYPAPFVADGAPAQNLALIVGDEAAASDVTGAIDVAVDLQSAAVVRKKSPAGTSSLGQAVMPGDSVSIGSTTDLLSIGEPIGSVREALTEVDLDMLKGGQIVTQKGATEYNQYLRFPSGNGTTAAGGVVIYGENEQQKIGHYLHYKKGEVVFQWELEFEEGLDSVIKTNGDLEDLEDEDVLILGMPFVIADTDFTVNTDTVTRAPPYRLIIQFLGGAISAALGENDKDTFILDGKDYVVEVLAISETNAAGEGTVKFRINGEITPELQDGDNALLADGTQIGIRDIITTGKNIQKSVVQFYLGSYSIEMRDDNVTDVLNQTATTQVNGRTVQPSTVRIRGHVLNNTLKLEKIDYTLFADATLGEVYVPPGSGVREHLQEPEGMLTPSWDIIYQGLADVPTTPITLSPSGDDEYNLEFVNQENITVKIPFVTNSEKAGCCKFGDDNDDLWFCEQSGTSLYTGTAGDYFLFSTCQYTSASTEDQTCKSHICRYMSAYIPNEARELSSPGRRPDSPSLDFDCIGEGRKKAILDRQDSVSFFGDIIFEDARCRIHADTVLNSPPNISVDLDCSGTISSETCAEAFGIPGPSQVGFTLTNTNDSSSEGAKTCIGNSTSSTVNISVVTLSRRFDDRRRNEQINIQVECLSDNRVSIRQIKNTSGTFFGPFTSEGRLHQGLSGYGAFYSMFAQGDDDHPETLIIQQPYTQRGAQVFVTGPGATSRTVSGAETFSEALTPFPTTISKLASEIIDITQYNAIVVGGPCANTIAAQLLGNPEQCWEAIPEGEAIIRAFEHANGNVALLVAGRTAPETRLATHALAARRFDAIQGTAAKTLGTTLDDLQVQEVYI